uniref:Response receiver domain-containing protein n=1 Tax=Candidatus Kentrum sp. MB TaxID=2138164 RepID=A0A450XX47_9GAMM|nr:MAG: hypothetical protein BECKMB1821G_GA0114241_105313 [Candidatus Kentron sp. MB]VFK33871.1 MAG: hypothetical protein BECKMB1821I_GA0114274_105513 [Candidatus Kentron sp. MB]VFK76475.1 MAG: hypothetical protein BECKMB1821H_GA0114242_105813 [Candidatus Kentron sp. MB]
MIADNAFQQQMSETAARFLQSVVVLDDKVVCDPPSEAANIFRAATGLQEPTKRNATKASGPIPKTELESGANGKNGKHRFELFQVVHGFAVRGVVCGTLNPLSEDGGNRNAAFQGILKAGKRADIVILDWQINNDKGRMAMELIEELMGADSEAHAARRRLILIYTGDDVNDVKDVFDERFGKNFTDRGNAPYRERDGFRVAFLSKPGSSPELPESVDFPELPEKAIEEFARMNTGLLSGAVLNGLAAIRENTHRILSRFPPELDGAYLAHRAMTMPPQEAESHIGPLLASELEDVLFGAGLEDSLSMDVVRRWLEEESGPEDAESIEKVLSEGTEKALPKDISKKELKRNPHKLTEFISGASFDDAKNADEQFAVLTTLRFPSGGEHQMTLGTVVREGDDNTYWLCITPACDCVRLIDKQHKLFFLRCQPAKNGNIHFLIPPEKDDAEYIPITVGFRIEDGHHWEFEPDPEKQMVLAKPGEGEKSFYFSTTENAKLHWVAELKPAHALRITHRFSSMWSRIGVTEAEWLRRRSDL